MAGKKGKRLIADLWVVILFVFLFCRSTYGGTPTNVRVTNVYGNTFTVSWTSSEAETGQVRYKHRESCQLDNW